MVQINFRIEDDLKSEADYILGRIGMSMSSALNVFVHQLVAQRGIPFAVCIPDEELSSPYRIRQAMEDYGNGKVNYHYHELPDDDQTVEVRKPARSRSQRTPREKALV